MGVLPPLAALGAGTLLSHAVRVQHSADETGVFSNVKGSDVVLMLLTLSVFIRVLNAHWSRMPGSVAMALGSIVCTGALLALSAVPQFGVRDALNNFRDFLMDFPDLVLHNMLGFLLFAAAIEVDLRNISRIWSTVLALSIVSTAISTLIISVLTYLLMQPISEMDFSYCLLFGAIVSPTDPVTVISIVNEKPDLLPASTKYFLLGESLLNDAVGVVLYLVFSEFVEKADLRSAEVVRLLVSTVLIECALGIFIGLLLAWLAYSVIKSVDDVLLEVMITFVLVGNINFICRICHASIPLASVFAGLFMGNYGATFAMKEANVEMFKEIWKLADETLNSVLFLMIGAAELFWNPQDLGLFRVLIIIVSIICISVFARAVSVALPLFSIVFIEWVTGQRLRHPAVKYRGGTITVLTWAGMRGGISIALALGVPDAFVKHAVPGHMTNGQLIFFMTFTLVVFSIVVQGLFFEPVVRAITRVSYRIMPSIGTSGGLGTYVSTMDFQDPNATYGSTSILDPGTANGDLSFEDEAMPRSTSWAQSEPEGDYDDQSGAQNILGPYNVHFPENQSAPVESMSPTKPGISRSRSMFEEMAYPIRGHPLSRVRYADRRQGSDTFQNLGQLEEPVTMQRLLNNLSRQGTKTIGQLLRPAVEDTHNYQLRRSRTAPNNAQYALNSLDDDAANDDIALHSSLASVLRQDAYREERWPRETNR